MSFPDEQVRINEQESLREGASAGRPAEPRRRQPRPLPVFVLADVSGSMEGEKIATLNQSVATMFSAFAKLDSVRGVVHVAVITFGDEEAQLHLPLTPAGMATWSDMVASGRTPMGAALDLTRGMLDAPDVVPANAFTPTLVLVSDGYPTDDWEAALHELLSYRLGAKALRLAVKVGVDGTKDAETVLSDFSTPGMPVMRADEVHKIAGFFRWVTATVTGHLQTGRVAPRLEDLDRL